MVEREPVVAIAHDYLTQKGGAERVVLAMQRAFPDAKIYTTLYDADGTYPEFQGSDIVTSALNKFPYFRKNHRAAFALLAPTSTTMRIPADVVLCSSSGWAHGFRTTGSMFVYCHSPARWLYLTEQYLGKASKRSFMSIALRMLAPALRRWDRRAAARADHYVANSTVVQERIQNVYGMKADIFHPPHSVDLEGDLEVIEGVEDFVGEGGHYLVVSRLLPYKNVDQVIEAFSDSNERLLIIGAGPLAANLQAACSANVRIVSNLSDAEMRWAYSSAKAIIAVSYEDFGITPLEGGAWGKPTIALRAGGYLDTIVEGTTGVFIAEPTSECIGEAVRDFRAEDWNAQKIREHVETFSELRFRQRLRSEVFELARKNTAVN